MLARVTANKNKKANKKATSTTATGADPDNVRSGTGVWPPSISVTRVKWNSGGGLARAPFVASATASGLCRVDFVLGRYSRDYVPFGGVQFVRKEDGAVQVDEDDLEEEEED